MACLLALSGGLARAAVEKKPAQVFVDQARRQELADAYVYPARAVPLVNSVLAAEVDGVVSRIDAPLGARVRRGQRVLTLRHTDPVYRYAPVAVTAPVGGIVSGVEVSEGTQVTRGQRLASVTDPARLRLVVEVPAPDLAAIHAGLVGEFRVTGGEPRPVRVRGVSPFVDPASGTASAELELLPLPKPVAGGPGAAAKVPPLPAPGQIGQASFRANSRQGVQITEDAVFYRGNDTFLRVIDAARKVRFRPVKLGSRSRGQVEVLAGLGDGEDFVVRASRFVPEGETVEIAK
jgi:multidrug efflux pump subunit AcrA (membrane-fusion protein)